MKYTLCTTKTIRKSKNPKPVTKVKPPTKEETEELLKQARKNSVSPHLYPMRK